MKNVSAATAGELLADGWELLDVRPPSEISKVSTSAWLIICRLAIVTLRVLSSCRGYCGLSLMKRSLRRVAACSMEGL